MAKIKFTKDNVVEALFEIPKLILKHILVDAKGEYARMDLKELLGKYTSLIVGNVVDNLGLSKEANEYIAKEMAKEELIEDLIKRKKEEEKESKVEKSKEGKDA